LKSKWWIRSAATVLSASILGCSPYVHPLNTHFDDSFRDFRPTERDMIKSAQLKREFPYPYDNVFDNTIRILRQYAIITKASRDTGIIAFIDIDAIFLEDKFPVHEFPFSLLLEKTEEGTMVFVHPMTSIYETEGLKNKPQWEKNWTTIKTAYFQKGGEFIERLTVQLTASNRWPWLAR
jgi:hypothetical protein